ncbi:MAG: hypothetical protein L6R36_004701 [Xanthoria steineri]|nr:MAG: hypothetical protein L6R36_004701 [Xanthoria steineri]
MDDFAAKQSDFLCPPNDSHYWGPFIQEKEERRLLEDQYAEALYLPTGSNDKGQCRKKLGDIAAYLEKARMSDKSTAAKPPAWNIYLTARCNLLGAVLEGKYDFHRCNDLGNCALSAKDARGSWKKDQDVEWKTMDDASQLCYKMREKLMALPSGGCL